MIVSSRAVLVRGPLPTRVVSLTLVLRLGAPDDSRYEGPQGGDAKRAGIRAHTTRCGGRSAAVFL